MLGQGANKATRSKVGQGHVESFGVLRGQDVRTQIITGEVCQMNTGTFAVCNTEDLTVANGITTPRITLTGEGGSVILATSPTAYTGQNGIIIGSTASAADNTVIIGSNNFITANGDYSIVIGHNNTGASEVDGNHNVVIGTGDTNSSNYTILIGSGPSSANGDFSIVCGRDSASTGTRNVVVGNAANADDDDCVALGSAASIVGAPFGIAVGLSASVTGSSSISIGSNSTAGGAESLSLGNNASCNGSQGLSGGNGASANGFGSIALGRASNASGSYSIACGSSAQASLSGVALGKAAVTTSGVAVGADSSSSTGVTIGNRADSDLLGVSVGYNSFASNAATAIGYRAAATADKSVCVGRQVTAGTAVTGITRSFGTSRSGDLPPVLLTRFTRVGNYEVTFTGSGANAPYNVTFGAELLGSSTSLASTTVYEDFGVGDKTEISLYLEEGISEYEQYSIKFLSAESFGNIMTLPSYSSKARYFDISSPSIAYRAWIDTKGDGTTLVPLLSGKTSLPINVTSGGNVFGGATEYTEFQFAGATIKTGVQPASYVQFRDGDNNQYYAWFATTQTTDPAPGGIGIQVSVPIGGATGFALAGNFWTAINALGAGAAFDLRDPSVLNVAPYSVVIHTTKIGAISAPSNAGEPSITIAVLRAGTEDASTGETVVFDIMDAFSTAIGGVGQFSPVYISELARYVYIEAATEGPTLSGILYGNLSGQGLSLERLKRGKTRYWQSGDKFTISVANLDAPAVVIGNEASSAGIGVAIGNLIQGRNEAVAIGYNCISGNRAVTIGANSGGVVAGSGTIAIGFNAFKFSDGDTNGVAIGYSSGIDCTYTTNNTFVGPFSGINIRTGGRNVCIGNQAGVAGPNQSDYSYAVIIGHQAEGGDGGVSIGSNAYAGYGQNNVLIGKDVTNYGFSPYNVVIGSAATTEYTTGCVCLGANAACEDSLGGITIGYAATIKKGTPLTNLRGATGGIAIGHMAYISSNNSFAISIGYNSQVTAPSGISIGSSTSSTGANAISIGNGSQSYYQNSIAIGTSVLTRRIDEFAVPGLRVVRNRQVIATTSLTVLVDYPLKNGEMFLLHATVTVNDISGIKTIVNFGGYSFYDTTANSGVFAVINGTTTTQSSGAFSDTVAVILSGTNARVQITAASSNIREIHTVVQIVAGDL